MSDDDGDNLKIALVVMPIVLSVVSLVIVLLNLGFDGILATGRLLKAKALYVQSHPGDYTGFAYYPSLKDFKAMLKFSGKTYDDWVQEVKNEIN